MKKSELEAKFDYYAQIFKAPTSTPQYQFHPTRLWRMDRAWPAVKVFVELMGNTYPKKCSTCGGVGKVDRQVYGSTVAYACPSCSGLGKSVGRHSRGSGYAKDAEKLNAATELGWRPFVITSDMLRNDPAGIMKQLKQVLTACAPERNRKESL